MINVKLHTDTDYDVIVAGLGTAGAIALITAAKAGLKVLGIEYLDAIGGTGTLGAIGQYYFGSSGGIYEQINSETLKLQKKLYCESSFLACDAKAYYLQKMATECGAEIITSGTITEVFKSKNTVYGLRVFNNGKFTDINSKIIIDCTGEADICVMAGCSFNIGREFDGVTQPFTNIIIAQNGGAAYGISKDMGYIRQHDALNLSQNIIESLAFCYTAAKNTEEKTAIITNAAMPGTREGRTIKGEQNLTLKGFFEGDRAKEPLFYAYSNADNHGKDIAFEDETLKDWYIAAGLWGVNFSVGVPLGALLPKGFDGIIAAGRCIAVDHNLSACVRMKSDMEKCGEAAAAAAVIAVRDKVELKNVDYAKLKVMLTATGCLDRKNDKGFVNRNTENKLLPVIWPDNITEMEKALKSKAPGFAIWSYAYFNKRNEYGEKLREYARSGETLLKKNASIALGLGGDGYGLPMLREMATRRDAFIPETSVKYSFTYGITAVYLLGRLKDSGSINILTDILNDGGQFDESGFIADEMFSSAEDVRFQYVSNALAALKSIGDGHPGLKSKISQAVNSIMRQNNLNYRIKLKANLLAYYDMTDRINRFIDKLSEE